MTYAIAIVNKKSREPHSVIWKWASATSRLNRLQSSIIFTTALAWSVHKLSSWQIYHLLIWSVYEITWSQSRIGL